MAAHIFKDAQVVHGSRDITSILNQLAFSYEADLKDDTILGADTRSRKSGLITSSMEMQGFWDSSTDSDFFADVGSTEEPLTVAPNGTAELDRVFFMEHVAAEYRQGNDVGELFGFTFNAQSKGPLVRGNLLVDGAKTATGNGSSMSLGAVAAGEKVYGALHVLAASGTTPTLDVIVQSDSDGAFSSPTTRLTFTQLTTTGAEALSLAGPVTDTHWRFRWTIGGSSPSFTIFASIGIL